MTNTTLGTEGNKMSILIIAMTEGGASRGEFERAVKHSSIVVDYEKSFLDNRIEELIRKYQRDSISRNARIAHRLMMTGCHTVKGVAEILELPERMIEIMLED